MGINGVIWRLPRRGEDIKQNGTLAGNELRAGVLQLGR